MRITVLVALSVAALGLAGCDIVTSTTPMFSEADAHGQAQLRAGVWMDEHQTCDFDVKAPVDTWPSCANGWVVRPGAVTGPRERGAPRAAWVTSPIVLAAGDPAVLQIRLGDEDGLAVTYIYAGVRPLKRDAEGRITEMASWPALCGPPPPPDPSGKDPNSKDGGGLTQAPIEGLTLDPAHKTCIATTPGPVHVSVLKSEAWNGAPDRSRWVRDGER
jgi:hypothetical protein